MNFQNPAILSLALLLLVQLLPADARAYDASWYKTDFWAGEYPHGFTLEKDVKTPIRAMPDPQAPRTIECAMKKGATYHPWNGERVTSAKLEFMSYVPIVRYVIKKSGTFTLHNEKTEKDKTISFKKGDEWTYLTYYAEGMFKMSFKGRDYAAEQELFEASKEKPGKHSEKDRVDDEWMKLTCVNGKTGWLLSRDVLGKPPYGSPNFIEYGVAKDK